MKQKSDGGGVIKWCHQLLCYCCHLLMLLYCVLMTVGKKFRYWTVIYCVVVTQPVPFSGEGGEGG